MNFDVTVTGTPSGSLSAIVALLGDDAVFNGDPFFEDTFNHDVAVIGVNSGDESSATLNATIEAGESFYIGVTYSIYADIGTEIDSLNTLTTTLGGTIESGSLVAASAVPEPSSLLLILAVAPVLTCKRTRRHAGT